MHIRCFCKNQKFTICNILTILIFSTTFRGKINKPSGLKIATNLMQEFFYDNFNKKIIKFFLSKFSYKNSCVKFYAFKNWFVTFSIKKEFQKLKCLLAISICGLHEVLSPLSLIFTLSVASKRGFLFCIQSGIIVCKTPFRRGKDN